MKLDDAITQFLASKSLTVRSRTVEWYKYCLRPLADALGNRPIKKIRTEELEAFLARQAMGRSPKTQESRYTALKTFFRWAIERGHLSGESSPMNGIASPHRKRERKIPEVYTDREIRALLRAVDNRRDRAILLTFLDTGVRRDELLSLDVPDADFDDGFLKVRGKGGKERFVPIEAKALAALREMLLEHPGHGALFRTHRTGSRLQHGGLRSMLLRLKSAARLTCRVYPHKFRHTFARNYLKHGDLESLREILGHEDITTTSRFYASFLRGSLKEKHRRCSPVELSNWNQERLW